MNRRKIGKAIVFIIYLIILFLIGRGIADASPIDENKEKHQGIVVLKNGEEIKGRVSYHFDTDNIVVIDTADHIHAVHSSRIEMAFIPHELEYTTYWAIIESIQVGCGWKLFEVFVDGDIKFMRRVVEHWPDNFEGDILKSNFWWAQKDGEMYPVRTKNELYKLCGKYKKEVKRYKRENNISAGLYGEGQLIKLIIYYNNLVRGVDPNEHYVATK